MPNIYLSLGSNKGNRTNYLSETIKLLNIEVGNITKISNIWESESWNYSDNDYLNAVIEIKTFLSPQKLLVKCQEIEIKLGRTSKTLLIDGKPKYTPRTIDIDILFYDRIIINTENLIIPHPNLHLRMFVLKPFIEVASNLIHPVFKKNIKELYNNCLDTGKIKVFKNFSQEKLMPNINYSKK